MRPIERIEKLITGELEPPPIARLLGFRITAVAPGRLTIEFDADERHANPMGVLHGGVYCDIADAAMGEAYLSELEEGETFRTLELKINYLRGVTKGHLVAEARVVSRGRRVGMVECDVWDTGGPGAGAESNQPGRKVLVARASSTCLTLRERPASESKNVPHTK